VGIGAQIKKLRKQRGFTLSDVVRASNGLLDKTTVSRIERDERGLSLKAAYAYSRVFNIGMETLYELVTGRKVPQSAIPFDTSQQERDFLKIFRALTPKHRRIASEIVKALAMLGDFSAPYDGRIEILKELKMRKAGK
jgi:transcriptional regulator with XRE-family HTH domain